MEYTITLPDSPSAIACGSDGAFLNPSGILGNGSSVAWPCSTGLLPCHNSQGAEDQSSTCPHRQTWPKRHKTWDLGFMIGDLWSIISAAAWTTIECIADPYLGQVEQHPTKSVFEKAQLDHFMAE